MRNIFYSFLILLIISCDKDTLPKPKAYLSLNYPKKSYHKLKIERPYSFDVLDNTTEIAQPQNWLKIEYPKLKASVNITYRPIDNNLKQLFLEAEKLVFEHTIKANQISSKSFENKTHKTYGKLFEITGNTASQVQFHITDSTKHFVKGALFFRVKPNYDSIVPAIDYIKKDMIKIMETLEWKSSKK